MKKTIACVAALLVLMLAGCAQPETTCTFESCLTDDPFTTGLLASEAHYAYEVNDDATEQTVYIWNNALRRDLRLRLCTLRDAVLQQDKAVNIRIENQTVAVNGMEYAFLQENDVTRAVIGCIFPTEMTVNGRELYGALTEMIIRLETLEYLGDTEVIAIKTKAAAVPLARQAGLTLITVE